MRRSRFALVALTVVWLLVLCVAVAPAMAATPTFVTKVGKAGNAAGTNPGEFTLPWRVATDGLGNVYVLDNRGPGTSRIQRFNTDLGFQTQWMAVAGGGWGMDITCDRQGNVYVAIIGPLVEHVAKYSPSGTLLKQFWGPAPTAPVIAVAVDSDGYVYSIKVPGTVQRFAPDGTYLGEWPATTGAGETLGIDSQGNLYVSDNDVNIKKFDRAGNLLKTFGGSGLDDGEFMLIGQISVDPWDRVCVSDATAQRIQRFTTDGVFIDKWGTGGVSNGDMINPWGVGADANGVYVADTSNNRVQKFTTGSTKASTRIGGANRYDVSANLVSARWPGLAGIKHVIVVCGEDRANADPLAAAGLAGVWDAPVLLTSTARLTGGTEGMLKSIRAANGPIAIHVIGGARSVPKAVFMKIAATNPGGITERIDGADRYALSAAIATRMQAELAAQGKTVPGVLIMNAENTKAFFDDLAASPIAARQHMPMLAVRAKSVPAQVGTVLATTFAGKPRYAVSGTGYLSNTVFSATGCSQRLAGSGDRIVAATEIASAARANGWLLYKNVGLANKLPDSLTGGSFMGLNDGVLLYTNTSPLATATSNFVAANKSGTTAGWVFGGPKSVADSTVTQFQAALATP